MRYPLPLVSLGLAVVVGLLVQKATGAETTQRTEPTLTWSQLPDLPEPLGLGGPYAGVSRSALIVAGGANFPEKMPWDGGQKVWHDRIYVLEKPDGPWELAETRLPRPLGYGVSLSVFEGLLCIGGGDATKHYTEVFLLEWNGSTFATRPFPPLPKPQAFACGAILGKTIYVAGGQEEPASQTAMKTFWALDMNEPRDAWAWKELEPWPGPARILAVAGVQDGSFFLFSGADLVPEPTVGKPRRIYLTDAYRFTPGVGWRPIAPVPHPVVAAPSPAAPLGQSHLAVFSGDDGAHFSMTARPDHPGFPADVLAYHTITDTWVVLGRTPAPRVTTPLVPWQGGFVVPSGEVRAGIRSPRVDLVRPVERRADLGPAEK